MIILLYGFAGTIDPEKVVQDPMGESSLIIVCQRVMDLLAFPAPGDHIVQT
jgi:hypothetical protein